MKVLIVANNKPGHFSPFVTDQVDALAKYGVEFDFLVWAERAFSAICLT